MAKRGGGGGGDCGGSLHIIVKLYARASQQSAGRRQVLTQFHAISRVRSHRTVLPVNSTRRQFMRLRGSRKFIFPKIDNADS